MLIAAITELSMGSITDTTEAFLKSLERPLNLRPTEKRVLFATNDGAVIYNRQQIHEMPGAMFKYASKDEGSQEHLGKLAARKVFMQFLLCL
jgi:hypothetical protein